MTRSTRRAAAITAALAVGLIPLSGLATTTPTLGGALVVSASAGPAVQQYLGTLNSAAVDPGFEAASSSHAKQFIDFDGDGFSLAPHTFTPIPPDHYAAQGITLRNLDVRSVGANPWSHSPPNGAWQTGFSGPTRPYIFEFAEPVASFGLFANDVEGEVTVTVHLTSSSETFTLPFQGGAATTRFHGFVATGNVIQSIEFASSDYHIIDDVQFGRVTDDVPPVVTGVPDRAANSAGWYNNNVTIDWQSTDPTPSSGTPTDPTDTLAATEGTNINYTSNPSCDPAGNCATGTLTLSIDHTPPTLTITGNTGTYRADQPLNIACNATDTLSGIATQSCPALPTYAGALPLGPHTYQADATDNAGNTTTTTFSFTVTRGLALTPDQCRNNGWTNVVDNLGNRFANQGDCISYLATNGRNKAKG